MGFWIYTFSFNTLYIVEHIEAFEERIKHGKFSMHTPQTLYNILLEFS